MEERICKLTKKLGDDKKLDTACLIRGFRHFSKGEDMLREVTQSLRGNPEIHRKLREVMGKFYKARETIDKALMKIAGPENET